MDLEIRPARLDDVPGLERRCWRGGEAEMRDRIEAQGTCSLLAIDAGRPVGQLYLRAYQPGFRSPGGLHDGAWWADLSGVDPALTLPSDTVMLGCWHVGRVRDPDGTERDAEEYRGRGLGIGLVRGALDWVRSGSTPFRSVAAKASDTEDRSYIGWLGGLPRAAFADLGFRHLATFEDPYLAAEPEAMPEAARRAAGDHAARFHLMIWTA